jgi:hypothetical protein
MSWQVMPARYRVTSNRGETHDTVSLGLQPVDQPIAAYLPGQFTMLYAFGIGEVPISISGVSGAASAPALVQTIRSVGAVTRALCAAGPGQIIGVRGPFGTSWDVAGAEGQDVVLVAGGIGLAPLALGQPTSKWGSYRQKSLRAEAPRSPQSRAVIVRREDQPSPPHRGLDLLRPAHPAWWPPGSPRSGRSALPPAASPGSSLHIQATQGNRLFSLIRPSSIPL